RPASAARASSERRIRDSNTSVRDASIRPSNLCRLKRCQSLAGASGERDDRLALVAVEGLAQSGGGLVTATGRLEHLGEVGECLALFQEGVAPQREVDCFAGQAFRLGVLPARGVDERLRLPPAVLGHDVLLMAELAPAPGEQLGLVVAAERGEDASEHRRIGRQLALVADRLDPVAGVAEVRRCGLVVAGEERNLAEPSAPGGEGELTETLLRRQGDRPGLV